MSVELHIKNVCRSAYSELRRISTIWHLLSVDSTKTLVSTFVLSVLDYCNSLLSGCPKHLEKNNERSRTQLMFHPSSELFTCCPFKHVSSLSCQHSSHSFFSDTAPVYPSDLPHAYPASRRLRSSSDSITLRIPHIKTKTFGHHSFSHAAPSAWNSLPREI